MIEAEREEGVRKNNNAVSVMYNVDIVCDNFTSCVKIPSLMRNKKRSFTIKCVLNTYCVCDTGAQ